MASLQILVTRGIVYNSYLRTKGRIVQKCVNRTFYLYSPEPFHPLPDRKPEWKTAEEAVQVIQSGTNLVRVCSDSNPPKSDKLTTITA